MHLAFVTYVKEPNLTKDDQQLAAYLSQKGIVVTPVLWDDSTINWQNFDAIVLRSMWDYFERPVEFNAWLDRLASIECTVLNPLSVVKWNQDKNYFDNFSERGISLPPYFICPRKSAITLTTIMKENGWHKAVVPVILLFKNSLKRSLQKVSCR